MMNSSLVLQRYEIVLGTPKIGGYSVQKSVKESRRNVKKHKVWQFLVESAILSIRECRTFS